MATAEQIARAEERMRRAQQELWAYVERPELDAIADQPPAEPTLFPLAKKQRFPVNGRISALDGKLGGWNGGEQG